MTVRTPSVLTSYFPFKGGMNDVASMLTMPVGMAESAVNFQVDVDGGYTRIEGYIAFDGAAGTVAAIPGTGSVLGVWRYNDVVYAFRNHTDGLSAKMWKSTAGGWVEVVTGFTLSPSGSYRFINHNFAGTAGTLKMYGCDGVQKAFQFDGTTFTRITTGMTTDTPHLIATHKNHLFLAFNASVQHSSIGNPLTWSPVTGAGEIGMGDTVTAMVSQSGDESGSAMVITTRGTLSVLYGSSSANWSLVLAQSGVGSINNTAQSVTGKLVALDDRGVIELSRSMAYGNFDSAGICREVNTFIGEHRPYVVASTVSRVNNQYRLFFSDGYGMYTTIANGEVLGSMPVYYPHPVTCVCSLETGAGDEAIYFGSTNGMVYKMGGNSFAGESISSRLYMAFNAFKSPRDRKRFRRMVLDVRGASSVDFDVGYVFDYASPATSDGVTTTTSIDLSTSTWDSAFLWDAFRWDTLAASPVQVDLAGTGTTCSIRVTNDSATTSPFTLSGAIFHYTPRRQER